MRAHSGLRMRAAGEEFRRAERRLAHFLNSLALLVALPLAVSAQENEVLPAPSDVAVCQIDYGDSAAVEISWGNPEMYEVVEFAIDGELVPAESAISDGADGVGIVPAPFGLHEFGVRGRVGNSISPWTVAEFLVLEESPVPEPIVELDCEFIPVMGGMVQVTWMAGADAWELGRVGFVGANGYVRVEKDETAAELLTFSTDAEPEVFAMFKNADGYFSPRFTVPCEQRTPRFRRGDCDSSGGINITDAIFNLNHLFVEGPRGFCDDACDSNDDGVINLADSLATLEYLFRGGSPPPIPGPIDCGIDETEDLLGGICFCPSAGGV